MHDRRRRVIPARRQRELKSLLEQERAKRLADLRRERDSAGREATVTTGVIDSAESVEAVTQDALHFSLIEMKTRVIRSIDDALERAGHDDFGYCAVCGDEISSRRLKALPFAVRCTPCEGDAETAQESARTAVTRLRRSTFEFS